MFHFCILIMFWKQYTQVQMLIAIGISSSIKYFLLSIYLKTEVKDQLWASCL
jgi:hypothetical protein